MKIEGVTMTIALISVYTHDKTLKDYYYRFLYDLLKQREPYQNISHKEMPTWENHVKFVDNKPYKDWFIIYETTSKQRVGSIYLSKENEIGIFLSKKQRQKGYGREALNSIMEYFNHVREIKANIAPLNSASICFFVNMGFVWQSTDIAAEDNKGIIQYTYRMTNPYCVEHAQEEVEV
jgi:RimJ/RimL family protein N-acetyltransferase